MLQPAVIPRNAKLSINGCEGRLVGTSLNLWNVVAGGLKMPRPRSMNTAISSRVTGLSGQKSPDPHGCMIPSATASSTQMNVGLDGGTSEKVCPPSVGGTTPIALSMNTAICSLVTSEFG